MARPAIVKVTDGGKELASWRISLIPDAPPAVEITADPTGDASGTLTAKWKATDDYGVAGITADIYLADEQDEGVGFSDAGILEFERAEAADQPAQVLSPRRVGREQGRRGRAPLGRASWWR